MSNVIRQHAFARAGLLGNPSDGYFGKTISFIIRQFAAEVAIKPSPKLVVVPSPDDENSYDSIDDLAEKIMQRGYYGGERLLKASVKYFRQYCSTRQKLHAENFEISYRSTIPRNVGMAGSSAIVTAALKSLATFYHVDIAPEVLASMSWEVETRELGIPAGLQDRVIQAMEGVVYMDFGRDAMRQVDSLQIGRYQQLPDDALSNIYVAFSSAAGEPTEVIHQNIKQRFEEGDPEITAAMETFASFAESGKLAIQNRDMLRLSELIDQNFDMRAKICQLNPIHRKMVDTARQCGVSAKFCGSGGAIVGIYPDQNARESLTEKLKAIGCQLIIPEIRKASGNTPKHN